MSNRHPSSTGVESGVELKKDLQNGAISSPVSTRCRPADTLLCSPLPTSGAEWYERRGAPNRADWGDSLERSCGVAKGGVQRDHVPHSACDGPRAGTLLRR